MEPISCSRPKAKAALMVCAFSASSSDTICSGPCTVPEMVVRVTQVWMLRSGMGGETEPSLW